MRRPTHVMMLIRQESKRGLFRLKTYNVRTFETIAKKTRLEASKHCNGPDEQEQQYDHAYLASTPVYRC